MWRWTVAPEAALDQAEIIQITYETGDPVALNGKPLSPAEMLRELNRLGGMHGVGRSDIVENRMVGMKSRGCYETPGGTIMLCGHRAMESITLDREVGHLKDELMPRYAKMIYNGYWWSPERKVLQALIDASQTPVNGTVTLKLYKGSVSVLARASVDSLYDADVVTFEDDQGAYDQVDAAGFIKLNALRLRLGAKRGRDYS
jgi:argininosuccinate synthase